MAQLGTLLPLCLHRDLPIFILTEGRRLVIRQTQVRSAPILDTPSVRSKDLYAEYLRQ